MERLNELDALRVIAIRNVLKGDSEEYIIRKIFRSYSKQFNTPLHLVEQLPVFDVLINFFEALFESMDDKDLETERLNIVETEEELIARQKLEDADEAELHILAQETIKQESLDKIKLPTEESKFKEAIRGMTKEVNLISDTLKEVRPEPGIRMVFDEAFDDSDLDKDSFGILD